jgi:hypothetical protein
LLSKDGASQAGQIGNGRNPSVDAPFQAREKVRIVVSAWSDAVICPAFDAAE